MDARQRCSRGFTLVELLVVIAIIGILVALLLPAVQSAREAARRTDCKNRLKQIGLACINFHDTYEHLPSGSNGQGMSWIGQILPYMEQQNMLDLVDTTVIWSNSNNEIARGTPLPFMQCPSLLSSDITTYVNTTTGVEEIGVIAALRSHYVAIMGAKGHRGDYKGKDTSFACPPGLFDRPPNSDYTIGNSHWCGEKETQAHANNGLMFPLSEINFRRVTDGTSHTMMAGEQSWRDAGGTRVWIVGSSDLTHRWLYNQESIAHPLGVAFRQDNPFSGFGNNDTSLGSEHSGGANVVFADGSVQFLNEDTDLVGVLLPLASRQAGEIAEEF